MGFHLEGVFIRVGDSCGMGLKTSKQPQLDRNTGEMPVDLKEIQTF